MAAALLLLPVSVAARQYSYCMQYNSTAVPVESIAHTAGQADIQ